MIYTETYQDARYQERIEMAYVLIVDDDPDAQEVLTRIVHSRGMQTRTASDGLEALNILRKAEEEPPSLIMLDLMMPTMDGFAVYNWLMGNPSTRHVPVIVVTACARDQVDMLRLPGVTSVVQKGGYDIHSLSARISRRSEERRVGKEC